MQSQIDFLLQRFDPMLNLRNDSTRFGQIKTDSYSHRNKSILVKQRRQDIGLRFGSYVVAMNQLLFGKAFPNV